MMPITADSTIFTLFSIVSYQYTHILSDSQLKPFLRCYSILCSYALKNTLRSPWWQWSIIMSVEICMWSFTTDESEHRWILSTASCE